MTRIALAGVWHETNTFVPYRTTRQDFERYQLAKGNEIVEKFAFTRTELGGAIEAAGRAGADLVPLFYAAAVPSGIVESSAFEWLMSEIMRTLEEAGRIDGMVLILHGAMVAEGCTSPEVALIRKIREIAGDIPIVTTLDLHANLEDELCDCADVIVGYDTFPHVDMAERGREALDLVLRMAGGRRPEHAHVKLPLLTVPQMQATSDDPMRRLVGIMHEQELRTEVWTASLVPGYPYSDSDRLGFSIYLAGDKGSREIANGLAHLVWAQRENFQPHLTEPERAITEAARTKLQGLRGPVILVDVADNVGGGSPGDGTVLLRHLLETGFRGGVSLIWDPATIEEIYSIRSDRVSLEVGGKATNMLGKPVKINGVVRRRGRVSYSRTGLYMTGQIVDMGRVAVLESGGTQVILTERRVMPFDDDHIRACGIEPRHQALIIAKSAVAWRAAFGGYASAVHYVRTPGFCPSDLRQLHFEKVRPCFPIMEGIQWQPN